VADFIDEAEEQRFQAYLKRHPTATRAQYHMGQVARQVKQGASHHSLGTNLESGEGFWNAGAEKAARYMSAGGTRNSDRVVDYGCGSLRIGAHFIRFLDPERFFGLDVTDEFYRIGMAQIGDALLKEKSPRFGVIGEPAIAEAEAFGADFVYSNAVCYQVHPEEQGTYFGNLLRLARKPGSRLVFNCMVADPPVRYSHRSWAWPLSAYTTALNELELVEARLSHERLKGECMVRPAALHFRRNEKQKSARWKSWLSFSRK